jgi:superfamily II DNA or RNA helicase
MQVITEEKLALYMSLFRGRDDVFARRWQKGTRSGYSPAYTFDWDAFLAHKAKGGNIGDFEDKQKIPLTKDIIKKHLIGAYCIGIYPLLEDNTSYFIAIDLDGKEWQSDCMGFKERLHSLKIPFYVEKSFSGKGCHIWIFFEDRYPAAKSRKVFLEIAKTIDTFDPLKKDSSFDRLFPNQDCHSGKGLGNLIALPMQGRMIDEEKMVFLDIATFSPINDQWAYLQNIKKVSTAKMDACFSMLSAKQNIGHADAVHEERPFGQGLVRIYLMHQILLNKNELGKDLKDFLYKNLCFVNTEYLIKQKIGRSTYGTEKFFHLIKESKNTISVPRGFLNELVSYCDKNNISFHLEDRRVCMDDVVFSPKISLKKDQKIILDRCKETDSAVIVSPPGSGKTIIGISLAAQKKKPTLILVHRRQIYEQWLQSIEDFLGIRKKDIGQICANKKKPAKNITVAMMQSLAKLPSLKEISQLFGTIIIDECHHIPAKTFRKLIIRFNPYYIYGLTATPKRKYNDEKLIFLYIGDMVTAPGLSSAGKDCFGQEEMEIMIRETDLDFPYESKTDDFFLLSKVIIFDSSRNRMIAQDAIKMLDAGNKVMILTERKEHVDVLYAFLKANAEVIAVTGDERIASKKAKIKQAKEGDFQILITTGQFLGEGFDIDCINCLLLVFPFSFEGKLIQYIGRILRSDKKKFIIDYRDRKISYLENLFKKRQKYYKKIEMSK